MSLPLSLFKDDIVNIPPLDSRLKKFHPPGIRHCCLEKVFATNMISGGFVESKIYKEILTHLEPSYNIIQQYWGLYNYK